MTKISVFGLGRVGLPLALVFAQKGLKVIGVDIDPKRVALISEGKMPFLEEGADQFLKKHLSKSFQATTDVKFAVENSQAIIITVGTPVDEFMNPILKHIEKLIEDISPFLKKGQLISLRSTVSPRTTEYLAHFIEKTTKFRIGKDLFLAFCPERIVEGQAITEISSIPQIIGGVDPKSSKIASDLYKKICDKVLVSDARSAEIAKLACNTFRYIQFAVGNEMMMIADSFNRDIYKILELVNKDYVRGGIKKPGFAAGPCLFKDGFFLVNDLPYAELISTAWNINERTPAYLVTQIKKLTKLTGKRVAILGLTFKKNSDDTRNSLSYKLKKVLRSEGVKLSTHDPYVEPVDLEKVLKNAEIVFVATNHDYYQKYGLERIKNLVAKECLICDIWNLFGKDKIIFKVKSQ